MNALMGKKFVLGISALAMAMAMVLSAGTASATHLDPPIIGDCATELNAVGAAIDAGSFLGQGPDQSNLLAKLRAADAKVDLGKYSDAIDKLTDISDKATALANAKKQKLDPEDAVVINDAVGVAIACGGAL